MHRQSSVKSVILEPPSSLKRKDGEPVHVRQKPVSFTMNPPESLDVRHKTSGRPAVTMGSRETFVTPRESPAMSRTSSMRSFTSVKQLQPPQNSDFLGVNTKSTWMSWSEARRLSFKNRIEELELKQKEHKSQRVSTPVRKARKESVMFVSSDLEYKYIDTDDEDATNQHNGPGEIRRKITVSAKKVRQIAIDSRNEVKLSMAQWNTLVKFWEHDLFVRCRTAGLLCAIGALIFGTISVANNDWFHEKGKDRATRRTFFSLTSSTQRERFTTINEMRNASRLSW